MDWQALSVRARATAFAGRRPVFAVALVALGAAMVPTVAQARAVRPAVLADTPWSSLAHPPPFNPGAILLLTDGRILVQDQGPTNGGASRWWILSPDRYGSYLRGTWTRAASLPAGYGPISFASAVLPDGRVLIEGGEDNLGHRGVETNRGAIYDPVANRWAPVRPPGNGSGGWAHIGDAPSAVLPDGQFMLGASGYLGNTVEALFDPSTLTWAPTGRGKADGNGEEGWTLLPSGDLLTVDVTDAPNTERFDPASGAWQSAGSTPVSLVDADGELGPALLMPNGKVLATGGTGHNAIYDTRMGNWSRAPNFPIIAGQQYDIADGPGAVLPDGDALLEASPGDYRPPAHFFLFNGSALKRIPDAPDSSAEASNYGYMLVLPTGQIMLDARLGHLYLYNAGGTPKRDWRPTVISTPTRLTAGATYRLTGRQLSGLTQGAAYGDDFQDATNYPLVRITNDRSHRVFYARTTGMTSMSVAPRALSSTYFMLPRQIATGPATLLVVVNGITSPPVRVTISSPAARSADDAEAHLSRVP
jgi:hypothetical protein